MRCGAGRDDMGCYMPHHGLGPRLTSLHVLIVGLPITLWVCGINTELLIQWFLLYGCSRFLLPVPGDTVDLDECCVESELVCGRLESGDSTYRLPTERCFPLWVPWSWNHFTISTLSAGQEASLAKISQIRLLCLVNVPQSELTTKLLLQQCREGLCSFSSKDGQSRQEELGVRPCHMLCDLNGVTNSLSCSFICMLMPKTSF